MRTKSMITRSEEIGTILRSISFLPVYSSFFSLRLNRDAVCQAELLFFPKKRLMKVRSMPSAHDPCYVRGND